MCSSTTVATSRSKTNFRELSQLSEPSAIVWSFSVPLGEEELRYCLGWLISDNQVRSLVLPLFASGKFWSKSSVFGLGFLLWIRIGLGCAAGCRVPQSKCWSFMPFWKSINFCSAWCDAYQISYQICLHLLGFLFLEEQQKSIRLWEVWKLSSDAFLLFELFLVCTFLIFPCFSSR